MLKQLHFPVPTQDLFYGQEPEAFRNSGTGEVNAILFYKKSFTERLKIWDKMYSGVTKIGAGLGMKKGGSGHELIR